MILGLRQLITEVTRYSPIKDSCLGLFFTNSDIISKVDVSNVDISDHQTIILTRKKPKFVKRKCDFIGRSYRNYSKDIFQVVDRARVDTSTRYSARGTSRAAYIK